MSPNKLILTLALILSSQYALADDAGTERAVGVQQVNHDDVVTALSLLIQAGIIDLKDGQIVVKEPSALEKLRKDGRVKVEASAAGSICF